MEGAQHTLLYVVGVGVGVGMGRRGRKGKPQSCQSNWVMLQAIRKVEIGLRSSKFQAGAGSRTLHCTTYRVKRQVRGVPFSPPLVQCGFDSQARPGPARLTQLPDASGEWLLKSTSLGISEQGSTQHTLTSPQVLRTLPINQKGRHLLIL